MEEKKENKVVVKRKLKLFGLLLIILIGVFLFLIFKLLFSIKINNIFIHNTKYLTDEYIIETAKLKNYPSSVLNLSKTIERRLEKSIYIKDAKVNKSFYGVVDIYIEENPLLFYREYDGKFVYETKEESDENLYNMPYVKLVNYVPDTIYDNFVNKYIELSEDVRDKISQVKYDPSEYDDSRFMLYMIDGNYVYITLTKIDSVNYYNEIYPTLNNKKGILYLDSGNHFVEIK